MKDLLILEMERAITLLKAEEKPFDYHAGNFGDAAELKRLLLSIRKHSISIEKEGTRPYWLQNK